MPEKKESEAERFRREATGERPDIMMVPMVDIVFQLLIFFMLACRFRTSEENIKAFLPKDRGLKHKGVPTPILDEVRVRLLWVEPNSLSETEDPDNGRVLLKVRQGYVDRNFKWVTNEYGEILPDYEELYELVKEVEKKFTPTKYHKTLPVIIDARPLVPFKHVVHVLNACLRAKLTDITFAKPAIEF